MNCYEHYTWMYNLDPFQNFSHFFSFKQCIHMKLYCAQLVFLLRRRSCQIKSREDDRSWVAATLLTSLEASRHTATYSCYLGCMPGNRIWTLKWFDPGKSVSRLERALTMVCPLSHTWIGDWVLGSLTWRIQERTCAWVCDRPWSKCLLLQLDAQNYLGIHSSLC